MGLNAGKGGGTAMDEWRRYQEMCEFERERQKALSDMGATGMIHVSPLSKHPFAGYTVPVVPGDSNIPKVKHG